MRHCRSDYNRIQDPALDDPSLLSPGSTPIGKDEPVFLLRARDMLAPQRLKDWADELEGDGGDVQTARMVRHWAYVMVEWQAENGCKLPDTPLSCFE